ncbi:MAG TPA: TIGR00725 family protein [Candidatus Caldiarchaeum subterraneum]|uniref:TIGR00725 family protein n=1 Tax=Caldiarchaeum subterraneum TaxID=311458 RepID=A0A832ZZI6_CALS0|nr:TIGR00725 family protein [Aigarchaeota archaeon]HIQ30241.1 TIGR00725 family protein [Candidatus Caldarchaeum subterraneum]
MLQIGVGGSSDKTPLEKAVAKAREFARRLAEHKDEVILLTGGDGGIMRIVCEEFVKAGGITLGVIPYEDEDIAASSPRYNPYNTIVYRSGQTFQARSIGLVRSCDSFAVLGGGSGTIIEAHLAYIYRVPLVVVTDTGYASDNLEKAHPDGFLDHRQVQKIHYTSNPVEAADLAYELAKIRSSERRR